MGSPGIWYIMAVIYGLVCGAFYTWASPRRKGTANLLLKSWAAYSVTGFAVVALLQMILDL